jgi:trigger factor
MATVTKENIGLLHDRITVKLEKTDYLPSFEKALKEYSKKANMPGFRKGMVPAGLIKKMYGASLFTDEVLKSVDRELIHYLQEDKLDIFAQPIPLDADIHQLDVNNPIDYTFHFEIGMKPSFELPDLPKAAITRYEVTVTDDMIDSEVTRLQNRYGNMKDEETVSDEENVLNVQFTETGETGNPIEGGSAKDNSILVKYFAPAFRGQWMGKKVGDSLVATLPNAFEEKEREWIISDLGLKDDPGAMDKNFQVTITKIGRLEKRELNEEFFTQLYPNQEVKTESDFRNKIKDEIKNYWAGQAANQVNDQVFHELVDHTSIQFPEGFLKKWMKTQGENGPVEPKSDEEVEKEFPRFLSQLKWTLITDKIVRDNDIKVSPDELRAFATQQLFSYMGNSQLGEDQAWVKDYIDRMMKDKKYVEDAYNRIQTQKVFEWAAGQVRPTVQEISVEDFTKMVQEHQHHHH